MADSNGILPLTVPDPESESESPPGSELKSPPESPLESEPELRPLTPTESAPESELEKEQRYALLRSLREEKGAEQFVRSISRQLLLQNDSNWGDLLGAAPAALCCLGQTFVAATFSTQISSLKIPMGNLLKRETLRANLVHCSDLGRKAFMEAESKMRRVNMITNSICEPNGMIDKILRLVSNEKLARIDLGRQLDRLKCASEECVKDAKDVEAKFKAWQDYALEIRAACVTKEDIMEINRQTIRDNISIADVQKSHQEEQVQRLKAEIGEMRSHMEIHQNAYNAARKAIPTGFNLFAQQFFSTIMDGAISLFQVGKLQPLLNLNFNPHAEQQDEEACYSKMLPNPNDDHGFTIVRKIIKQLHWLNTCLSHGDSVAPNYGVDWDALYGFPRLMTLVPRTGGPIDVVLAVFDDAKTRTSSSSNTNSGSSKEAVEILNIAIEVAEEINASKKEQKSIKAPMEPRSAGRIHRWREKIRMACDRIDDLEEKRQTALKLFSSQLNGALKSAKRPKKAHRKWDGLKFARENYQASQSALRECEDRLAERAAREAEAKARFNEIQLDLARSSTEDLNMAEIIGILKRCIDRLTEFQDHLGKLVKFFDGLNNFIEIVHRGHAQEFLAQVNNVVEIDAENEHEAEEIRRREKKELVDCLLMDTLQLRGHCLVAGELAAVYVDVSQKHIMPGVNQIDRLGISHVGTGSKTAEQSKVKAIQAYARKAQSEISSLAAKRQADLRKELFDQEREIEEIGFMIEAAEGQRTSEVNFEDDQWDSE